MCGLVFYYTMSQSTSSSPSPPPPAGVDLSPAPSARQVLLFSAIIMIGCCSNVLFLEFLTQHDPGCGDLVTLAQFTFISLCSFPMNFNFSTFSFRPRRIPLTQYISITALFFIVSILNNRAFQYGVSVPVTLITLIHSNSLSYYSFPAHFPACFLCELGPYGDSIVFVINEFVSRADYVSKELDQSVHTRSKIRLFDGFHR